MKHSTDRFKRMMQGERAANANVTLAGAAKLWNRDRVDWPVSGDESRRANGYIRRGSSNSLWTAVQLHGVLNDPLITIDR